jgi:hypothetical protein
MSVKPWIHGERHQRTISAPPIHSQHLDPTFSCWCMGTPVETPMGCTAVTPLTAWAWTGGKDPSSIFSAGTDMISLLLLLATRGEEVRNWRHNQNTLIQSFVKTGPHLSACPLEAPTWIKACNTVDALPWRFLLAKSRRHNMMMMVAYLAAFSVIRVTFCDESRELVWQSFFLMVLFSMDLKVCVVPFWKKRCWCHYGEDIAQLASKTWLRRRWLEGFLFFPLL